MGNRLSRISTKTGDDGTTGLADGSRVRKCGIRIDALGEVDELNSTLGMLISMPLDSAHTELLLKVQHHLFDLGGELAIPGRTVISAAHVEFLETAMNDMNGKLPPLREFILPGGSLPAAVCHLSRSVARRAERAFVRLALEETVNAVAGVYLNRLSDLLFVLARVLARENGGTEVFWEPSQST